MRVRRAAQRFLRGTQRNPSRFHTRRRKPMPHTRQSVNLFGVASPHQEIGVVRVRRTRTERANRRRGGADAPRSGLEVGKVAWCCCLRTRSRSRRHVWRCARRGPAWASSSERRPTRWQDSLGAGGKSERQSAENGRRTVARRSATRSARAKMRLRDTISATKRCRSL